MCFWVLSLTMFFQITELGLKNSRNSGSLDMPSFQINRTDPAISPQDAKRGFCFFVLDKNGGKFPCNMFSNNESSTKNGKNMKPYVPIKQ